MFGNRTRFHSRRSAASLPPLRQWKSWSESGRKSYYVEHDGRKYIVTKVGPRWRLYVYQGWGGAMKQIGHYSRPTAAVRAAQAHAEGPFGSLRRAFGNILKARKRPRRRTPNSRIARESRLRDLYTRYPEFYERFDRYKRGKIGPDEL